MEYVSLEKVCDILDSQRIPITASERKKGMYPYFGANGIQDYVADFIFDDELVLLAEDGGNFGSKDRPIAFRVSGKCWVNNHAHVLKPKECINVDYLCYSLMFYDTTGIVNGATRQKLTQTAMRQMTIPLVSQDEQKDIVRKLNKVECLISQRKQQLSKLDELVKSRFVELFGDPVTNEKRWNRLTLGDICEICSSKRVFEKDYVSTGVPFFRTKEIVELSKGNKISTELFITEEHFKVLKENYGAPQKDDLLISAVGTIGTIWIVNGDFDFYFKDGNLIQIKSSGSFNSVFMKFLLDELIANYKKEMSTGTAYSALTIAGLKKMLVYNVPLGLQNEFADFVKQIDKSKLSIKQSLEKLETLKKSLMQQYFG